MTNHANKTLEEKARISKSRIEMAQAELEAAEHFMDIEPLILVRPRLRLLIMELGSAIQFMEVLVPGIIQK